MPLFLLILLALIPARCFAAPTCTEIAARLSSGLRPWEDFTALDRAFEQMSRVTQRFAEYRAPEEIPTVETTRQAARQSGGLSDAWLLSHGVPREYWRFYDRRTGEFRYVPPAPSTLELENGSHSASTAVIHYSFEVDNSGNRIADSLIRDYARVLAEIPSLRLAIVYNVSELARLQAQLASLPVSVRSRIELVPNVEASGGGESPLWAWARDVATHATGNVLLLPRDGRAEYRRAAEALERRGLARIRDSAFKFEGGNIIAGERHVFVGPEVVETAMTDFRITRSEALAALSAEFGGKPVLEIGFPRTMGAGPGQVTFHIDLSMVVVANRSLSGPREVILLESPRKILEGVLGLPNIDTLTRATYRSALAAGIVRLEESYRQSGRELNPEERTFLLHLSLLDFAEIRGRDQQVSFMTKLLEKEGYRVEPIVGATEIVPSPGTIENSFNYTNAVLSGDRVFLPELNIRFLDDSARQSYAALGYRPIGMPSARQSFLRRGGTCCSTGVLR